MFLRVTLEGEDASGDGRGIHIQTGSLIDRMCAFRLLCHTSTSYLIPRLDVRADSVVDRP